MRADPPPAPDRATCRRTASTDRARPRGGAGDDAALARARAARRAAGRLRDRRSRDRQDDAGQRSSRSGRGAPCMPAWHAGNVSSSTAPAKRTCRCSTRSRDSPVRPAVSWITRAAAPARAGVARSSCRRSSPPSSGRRCNSTVGGATRERMLREMAEAVEAMTAESPLDPGARGSALERLLDARSDRLPGPAPRCRRG